MVSRQITVFWSYAHDDDRSDGGRLLQLSQHLKDEYALLTGSDLEMFVDRDGLAWGDAWRKEIDAAIMHSSFLLAVITPRYFARPECRRELLEFHRKSEGQNPLEMVLPILYTAVQGLTEDNRDEAVAMVARTQYSDWSNLRLAAIDSSEYRRAVNTLATRLAELVSSVSAERLRREIEPKATDSEPDLEKLLRDSETRWVEWLSAVQADEVRTRQHWSVVNTYTERQRRWRLNRGKPAALLSMYQQEGRDLLPLERLRDEWAEVYSTRTIELDPLVSAAVRLARENPAAEILLADIQEKVELAVEQINRYGPAEGRTMLTLEEYLAQMPFVSQAWKEIRALHRHSNVLAGEANEIVLGWQKQLLALNLDENSIGKEESGGE